MNTDTDIEEQNHLGQKRRGPRIFLAVLLILLVPFLLQIAWPFLTSFFLAGVLAVMMDPIQQWLSRRIQRPGLTAFLVTFATVFALGIIVAVTGVILSRELRAAYDAISQRSLQEGGWLALMTQTADRVVDALATRLPLDKEAIRTELLERMKTVSGYVLNNTGAAIGGVTTVAITTLLVTIFLYFLLRYGEDWVKRLAAMAPLDRRTSARILRTVHDSIVANVTGVLAAVVGQGVLLGLGFWFVGLQSPVLWGAIGGLASIIPVVGAPIVWVPVAIAFLFVGAYWKALILVLWGSLIVGSADNVLRPLLVGSREKQHPVLIALAAIGGTYAFGGLGIILGPILVSFAGAITEELQRSIPSNAIVTPQTEWAVNSGNESVPFEQPPVK